MISFGRNARCSFISLFPAMRPKRPCGRNGRGRGPYKRDMHAQGALMTKKGARECLMVGSCSEEAGGGSEMGFAGGPGRSTGIDRSYFTWTKISMTKVSRIKVH